MIPEEYIDLIHKDIDKIISNNEKYKLDQYLIINPEANLLYNELLKTEEMLDKIYDKEPTDNLKKRILNSIDYNNYSVKSEKGLINKLTSQLFYYKKSKYAFAFSLGVLLGIILFSLIFIDPVFKNYEQSKNIYGSIGLIETDVIKEIEINVSNIKGQIKIDKGLDFFGFDINLKSSENFNLQIEFDPQINVLENFLL